MERVSRNRAVAILLLFATVLGLFGFRMYGLQIRDADPNSSLESTYTTWSRVTAAPWGNSGPERQCAGDQPGQLQPGV